MRIFATIISINLLFLACSTPEQQESTATNKNQFAKHFSLTQKDGYTLLQIINPWVDAQNIQYQYAITENTDLKLDENILAIKKNPKRVAAISTTHIAFLEVLNELEKVSAVSDKAYVYSSAFHRIDSIEEISEVGFDANLNIERLLQLKVDIVFLYGISNEIEPLRKRLLRAGIVPVMIGEYMEQHPLGKAEWIKVFGAIFNKTQQANYYFDSIHRAYTALTKMTDTIANRPTVFTGLPWNDTWHTPGGNTYTAKLIDDASGQYIFATDTTSINYQYDTEIVYEQAGQADYWIHPGTARSLSDIEGKDNRLTLFKAFKKGNIYNNNRRSISNGGSDYMESGVVNPHLILKDLIQIFHPNKVTAEPFYYYRKLD